MVKKKSFNQLQQFLISAILLSSNRTGAVQITQQAGLQAEAQSQLKLEMTHELMNQAMQHVLQTQNIAQDKISDEQLNQGINHFLQEANLTQMILDKQKSSEKQEQELVQTQSKINNQALSEVTETLVQLKCAVGQNCVYSDKKNLVKGKMNLVAKKKIIGSKSVPPVKGTVKGNKALAQKKLPIKTPIKAKSVPVKNVKKPIIAKKPITPQKKTLSQVKTSSKTKITTTKAKPAASHPIIKAKAVPIKKPIVKKPKVKQNIQVEAEGNPYKITKGNLMLDNGIQNPIDAMMNKAEEKTLKMGNVHVEGDNGSQVGFSAHKNFHLIYNSMDHGKDITHHDLDAERREQGDNLKSMGSMSQKAGEVNKGGDFKKGHLDVQHDVQLNEDQVEIPVEQEQPENEKLMNKIDIDGMFKKFSPDKTEKPKIDVKALQKKIAKKVLKAQNAIDQTKKQMKDFKVDLDPSEEVPTPVPETQEKVIEPTAAEQVVEKSTNQVEQDQVVENTEVPQATQVPAKVTPTIIKKQFKPKALAQKKLVLPKVAQKPLVKKEAVKKAPVQATKVHPITHSKVIAKKPVQDPKVETDKCQPKVDSQTSLLQKQGHTFQILTQDENQQPSGEKIEFNILPKNLRDSVVGKEVQVLNSEKIIGYTALGGGSTSDKMSQMIEDSDYYNVTVNLIVKRDSEFSVKQKNKESQMLQEDVEEIPVAQSQAQVEQGIKETGEQKEDAQSQLEMAAALSSPQEVKEELAQQESYTSKIAKNQVESETQEVEQPTEAPVSSEVPADQVNAQLTNEMDMAIQAAEQSSSKQELFSEKAPMSEEKGMAVMSFDAAASIGQYTGDMPTDTNEEQFAHYKGITTDQAIALAEKHNDLEEQNVQLSSQLNRYYNREDIDSFDENGDQFVEYIVPSDQTVIIENAFDNKESQHDQFMKRVQQKEADTIKKQSNKVKTHPQVPFNLAQQLSEVQEQEETVHHQAVPLEHRISADEFDGEKLPEEPVAQKVSKDEMSLETKQDNISPNEEEDQDGPKLTKKQKQDKEEQEAKERQKEEQKKVKDELKEKQVELEHHIQTDLMELAEVVNKRYGDNEHKFDYQLVRISDTRPKPAWQGPLDSDKDENDEEEEEPSEPESGGDESIQDHYRTPEEDEIQAKKERNALRKQKREQAKKERDQQDKKDREQDRKEKKQQEEEDEQRRARKKKEKEHQEEIEKENEVEEDNKPEAGEENEIKEKDFPKKDEKEDNDKEEEAEPKKQKNKKQKKNTKKSKKEKNFQKDASDLNVKDLFQKEYKRVGLSQQQQQIIESEKKQNQIDKKLRKEFKRFEQQAIMAANNEVNTDDSTVTNAEENEKVQAEVDAAEELKNKATSEASAEEKARQELKEQAELLAQADLKAKEKIKEAALMAAEAQKQNAIDVKKKLQDEADTWMKKNKQLIDQQEAAQKAQKEAQDAIEAEKREREILAKEKNEREAIEKVEKEKADAKVKIISKIAKRTSKKAHKLQTLLKKKNKGSVKESDVRDAVDNGANNENDVEAGTKAKQTDADKKFINEIVDKASKLKSTKPYVSVSVAQQEPQYHIEELEKEQPYERAIKPEPTKEAAPKKLHHHHKKGEAASPAVTALAAKEEAKPTPQEQMQPQSRLQKEQQDPNLSTKATEAYNKKMSELQDKEQDEQIRAVVDASNKASENGDDSEAQQTQSDINLEESLALKEKEAMSQVVAAQKAGEAKGRQAAIKMIQQQKKQTPKQNAAQVKELRNKLTSTSQQVNAIINNFEKVHEEMNELKQEYVQSIEDQQQQPDTSAAEDSEIQLSGTIQSEQESKSKQSHLSNLKQLLNKQQQLRLQNASSDKIIKNKK